MYAGKRQRKMPKPLIMKIPQWLNFLSIMGISKSNERRNSVRNEFVFPTYIAIASKVLSRIAHQEGKSLDVRFHENTLQTHSANDHSATRET